MVRRVALCALLVAAFAGLAGPARAQTELRYKFKKGETLRYVVNMKMDAALKVLGQKAASKSQIDLDLSWTVKSVDKDGNAKVLLKFDRVRFAMNDPLAGKLEYDSKDGKMPDGPFAAMLEVFSKVAGAEMDVTLTPRGEAKEVKLSEALVKELEKQKNGLLGGALLDGETLKKLGSGGVILPEKAVEKGDSWDQKVEGKFASFGKMKADMTYVYEGPVQDGSDLQKLTVKAKIAVTANPDAKIKIQVKAKEGTGAIVFDSKAGRLVEMTLTQPMEVSASAEGVEIAQNLTQTVVMKLVEKE